MTDRLLNAARSPLFRRVVTQLGLPLPLPQTLRRFVGSWPAQPLAGARAVLSAQAGEDVRRALREAGAVVSTDRPDVLLFDARALRGLADVGDVYEFFHAHVRALAKGGRAIVIGSALGPSATPAEHALHRGLDGFTRALAKEIGRRGATANTLFAEPNAPIDGPLWFLCSAAASFITAQPWRVRRSESAQEIPHRSSLDGKTALVTGAARGIGNAIAYRLAQEGARVVLVDRPSDDALLERAAEGTGGVAVRADITTDGALDEALIAAGAPIDIFVANAGITRDKTIARMTREQWDLSVSVNLEAALSWTQQLADAEHLQNGRVVLMSSVGGIAGNPGQTNYAFGKAALMGFASAMAPALAERGATINAVAPGLIETAMTAKMPTGPREAARRLSILGQGGQASDVAELTTFLCTPWAQGVTGQTLRVCGGNLVGA
ncbi:MAG: 3-oxoacyl-[acyl-carrier protein] reductase [Bradymonadia bacterium]|jgi:3-oxoacyl-[acyl-carrier protein] reductase